MLLALGAGRAPSLVTEIPTSQFPCERVAGLSISGRKWLAGGMRGLYIGEPNGQWKLVSDQAVRQVATNADGTWILYGNGSVDKVVVPQDRLYYDVFHGAVKRPWVSSMSSVGKGLTFGSHGGWFDRTSDKPLQESYPPAMSKQEVTCQLVLDGTRHVGTQDGLFVFAKGGEKRLGFGNGLGDTWITSMALVGSKVFVGTYTSGLYELADGVAKSVQSPSKRVRSLTQWQGNLVLGSLDGTWMLAGGEWKPLGDGETTFLTDANGQLVVGSVKSVRFFR
ncbi:MAG: hypothetical protein GC165_04695 [Armatimonadetes bacterium]|nr:hypothetical protein [Armatimonadota bacterium]